MPGGEAADKGKSNNNGRRLRTKLQDNRGAEPDPICSAILLAQRRLEGFTRPRAQALLTRASEHFIAAVAGALLMEPGKFKPRECA